MATRTIFLVGCLQQTADALVPHSALGVKPYCTVCFISETELPGWRSGSVGGQEVEKGSTEALQIIVKDPY